MSSQSSSSMSHQTSQSSCLDPLDSLIDFSEYDKLSYPSSSVSPSIKSQFSGRAHSVTPLPSSTQPDLSGPSHNYTEYRQATGIPQGAIATTTAINQMNAYNNFGSGYLSGVEQDFDFNTAPVQGNFPSDMDLEFNSPESEPAYFYPESSSPEFINPSAIGAVLPTQTNQPGRVWPGIHAQQAALAAKAQAQQKQQQQIIQQQRQQSMAPPQQQRPRPRSHTQTDPIVEEKISQLLNSMRQSSVDTNDEHTPQMSAHRMRKEEEDMDEDERLLASEEGKKLSSKERRQLRNKVSARAFRSRRKEYISQLEGEIAVKVNENSELRSQNRALMEENTRLSDLTRMLLSSPSFSGFLDSLATNPAAAQAAQAIQPETQSRQVRKDINPYAAQNNQPEPQVRKDVNPYAAQRQQQQHIGMTMMPEQNMDFSMLDLNNNGLFYQPQVFSVLSVPEAAIDTEILSGKGSSSVVEKVELPTVERAPVIESEVETPVIVDEEFDADPAFALYAPSPATISSAPVSSALPELDLNFLANLSIKESKYELVVEHKIDESVSDAAMRKVDRIAASMDACMARLMSLTSQL